MSVQTSTDILAQTDEDEVVKAPLPPAFVAGLAEALPGGIWNWLHEHAPSDLIEVTWSPASSTATPRGRGPRRAVCLPTWPRRPRGTARVLEGLQAHGGNLHAVCMISGGVA